MDAISADGLRKAYGDTVALRGVSLSVGSGEVFALLGPNGAGKTTLIRCLTGTTAPDSGTSTLVGGPPDEIDASRLGLLPQSFSPPERLTARELLSYYAGLYDDARDVESVLRDVGIDGAAETRYANLSGGQRRRTLVGTALVNDPGVLFLDEPTTGIDPAGRRAVWSLVEDLADAGTTVFLTTHSMDEAERLADRVAVIVDGEIEDRGTPGEIVDRHGGPSRLVVETDADLDGAELDGWEVRETGRGFLIEGIGSDEIGGIVDALDRAGIGYDALVWRDPGLETAYLALTGEAPRAPDREGSR